MNTLGGEEALMISPFRTKLPMLVQRRLQVERRSGKRLVPGQKTLCVLQLPGEEARIVGAVQNLSVRGVGILVDRPVPLGTQPHALLINASHTFAVAVDLKIVRLFRVTGGQYFLGAPFYRELSHEEFVPFVM
jgi:hypothetical protein